MSIKSFFDELRKGFKAPVYLLHSEDQYLLKEALFSIKKTISEEERDFGLHVFDLDSPDDSAPAERIIDVLNTASFFGGRRVVAVENVQKMKEAEIRRMAEYAENPSPDAVLFLLNTGTLKKGHKEGLSRAKTIPVSIKERDIPDWLSEKASRNGIRLTRDAVDYLIGTIGPDAGLLSSEIEKLTLIGKETLKREDIAPMVRGYGDYDAFDLINALRSKDAKKVFRIYRALMETQEPYSLLGALNWHYGRSSGGSEKRTEVFALLNEADTMLKSSGGIYPLECLLVRLLRL